MRGEDERGERKRQVRPVQLNRLGLKRANTISTGMKQNFPVTLPVMTIKRIWEGGPLRQWSEKRQASSWLKHREGYVGMYVCDHCHELAPGGVYSVRQMSGHKGVIAWLCAPCRFSQTPKREQTQQLRKPRLLHPSTLFI